jgi:hypothetical protein
MSQQDFVDAFDLGLLAPDATGVTSNATFIMQHVEGGGAGSGFQHQTLAERMQGDKQETLSSLTFGAKFEFDLPTFGHNRHDEWLEASSDLQEMMELGEVEEVKDENDHQPLIDEVEEFLNKFDTSIPIVDVTQKVDNCPINDNFFDDEALLTADQLIDQLFDETVALELNDDESDKFVFADETVSGGNSTFKEEENDGENVNDESGYVSSLNVSEMQLEDGTNVIFVISPDDSASVQSDAPEVDSDESWSPASAASSPSKRKASAPRGLRRTKHPVIDKKERKKIQNVEAARRYRDKKKSEQQLLDEELDELSVKNSELKSKVSEKENELKTLKKLMVELGLVKIAKK